MTNRFESDTDNQVVERSAGGANRGTVEEMTRRLKNSIETLDQNLSSLRSSIDTGQKSADRLNRRILWLTVAIFVFTAGMFFLGVIQLFR